jgi:hypothetical protein
MKVSLKSRAGSIPEKLGIFACLDVSKSIHEASCGLAYADLVLSKDRESKVKDKHVQLFDVSSGLRTAVNRAEWLSKTLKSNGYERLAKEAKSVGTAASKLLKEVVPTGQEPTGRVKGGDKQKLENGVKKLRARMVSFWGEAREACGGAK